MFRCRLKMIIVIMPCTQRLPFSRREHKPYIEGRGGYISMYVTTKNGYSTPPLAARIMFVRRSILKFAVASIRVETENECW